MEDHTPTYEQRFYLIWESEGLEEAKTFLLNRHFSEEQINALMLCPLHGVPLGIGTAWISYGRPSLASFHHNEKERRMLPFKNRWRLGGSTKFPDQPRSTTVICCRKCRSFSEWLRTRFALWTSR